MSSISDNSGLLGKTGRTYPLSKGIISKNLVLLLDANNSRSYPGSGTTWYDLSGNGYNALLKDNTASLSAGSYTVGTSFNYFNFAKDSGYYADVVNTGTGIALDPTNNSTTYVVVTKILNSTSDARTLSTPNSANQKNVYVPISTNNLGSTKYAGTVVQDSYYDITSALTDQFNILYFRWDPDDGYIFSYNDTPNIRRGDLQIGKDGKHQAQLRYIGGLGSSEDWGSIAYFSVYNIYLTDLELLQNYYVLREKYGLL